MTPADKIRQALQDALNAEGDGWILNHWVVVMGLEQMQPDGQVKTSAWLTHPEHQPDYITDGLVSTAGELREACDVDEDD